MLGGEFLARTQFGTFVADASASAAKKAIAHARAQHAESAKQRQPRCGLIASVPRPAPVTAPAPLIALPMHALGEQAPIAGGQPVRSMPSSDSPQAAAYRSRGGRGQQTEDLHHANGVWREQSP